MATVSAWGLSLCARTGFSRLSLSRRGGLSSSRHANYAGALLQWAVPPPHFICSPVDAYFHLFIRNLTVVVFVYFVTVGPVASLHCVTVFSTAVGANSISLTSGGALLAMLIWGAHVSSLSLFSVSRELWVSLVALRLFSSVFLQRCCHRFSFFFFLTRGFSRWSVCLLLFGVCFSYMCRRFLARPYYRHRN